MRYNVIHKYKKYYYVYYEKCDVEEESIYILPMIGGHLLDVTAYRRLNT